MSEERAVATIGASGELSIEQVGAQVGKIQALMRSVMHDGEHYGVIPGTNKPTLLKPGAEKLGFTFRLVPNYDITERELPDNHREYTIKCTLIHAPTGMVAGEGVGLCSSMESKYRYRNADDYEVTDSPIPEDAKERKREYRKQGYGMKKISGAWCWIKYKNTEEKQENPDIADTHNTVLKMAKKRAHIDAMITATAASDIFTQDLEDFPVPPTSEPARPRTERDATPPKSASRRDDREDGENVRGLTNDVVSKIQGLPADKAKDYRVRMGKAGKDAEALKAILAELDGTREQETRHAQGSDAELSDADVPDDADMEPDDKADLDAAADKGWDDKEGLF